MVTEFKDERQIKFDPVFISDMLNHLSYGILKTAEIEGKEIDDIKWVVSDKTIQYACKLK